MRLLKFLEFINESRLYEGGNAVGDARPIKQSEVDKTYEYVIDKVLPILKIDENSVRPLGSFKKKMADQTSGDIDIAVLVDAVAGNNNTSLNDVLSFIEQTLSAAGYIPTVSKGFQQVSIGVPVEGKPDNGIAQIDLMLTDNLDFSTFMYHSPDFTKAESKYKGLYRNILLMMIVGNAKKQTSKLTDKGEVEEYKSYVLRLNQGVVLATKTFMGAKGIGKTAKLLKDQDVFITNTPDVIAEIAFGPDIKAKDIMTFESIWTYLTDAKFIHRDKLNSILVDFKRRITETKVPFPTECVNDYPEIFQ